MQQKNLIAFLMVTVFIIVSTSLVRQHFWPDQAAKHKQPPARVVSLPDRSLWAGLPAKAQAVASQIPIAPGVGNAVQLATQAAVTQWAAGERKPPPAPEAKVEKVAKAPPAAAPKVPHRDGILLGNDHDFNLKVTLTTRGAGVESVVLNRFQEADTEGRPVWRNAPGQPRMPEPLSLVPENTGHPSNLLYHYAEPVEGHPEHPLDTLGVQDWVLKSVNNGPEVAEAVFTTEVPSESIVVTKTYRLKKGDYHLGLSLRFEKRADSGKPVQFRYQLAGAHGLPIEGLWYTYTFRNAMIGRVDDRGNVWRDLQMSQNIGYEGGGTDVKPDDKAIQYAAVATQYFTAATIVDDQQPSGVDRQKMIAWARPTIQGTPDPEHPNYDDITVRVVSEPFELKPGVPVTHQYLLYNGPVKVRLLGQLEGDARVDPALVQRYETTLHLFSLTDYGKFGIWSDLIIFFTNLIHGLLRVLHTYVMPWSYGLCIILVTVIVRGCMSPLSRKQAIASAKMQAKMAELAPDVKKLEEKFKNDTLALQQAKNELYMKRGVHPLAAMGGCWILLLQLPVFMGLYYALQESIYFRLAPFLWMPNLAAPDMLFRWGPNVPIISGYLGPFFNILPIVAVALQMVQQKMMMPPPTDEQQAMQQKMTKWMMVFIGIMFYKWPAGMCIYFTASSAWGLIERKLLVPKIGPSAPGSSKSGPPSASQRPRPPQRPPKNGNGTGTVQKMREMWERVLKEARKK